VNNAPKRCVEAFIGLSWLRFTLFECFLVYAHVNNAMVVMRDTMLVCELLKEGCYRVASQHANKPMTTECNSTAVIDKWMVTPFLHCISCRLSGLIFSF